MASISWSYVAPATYRQVIHAAATIAPRPFKCSNQTCLAKSPKLPHKQNQTCYQKLPPKSDTTFNLPGQNSDYMHVKGMSIPPAASVSPTELYPALGKGST